MGDAVARKMMSALRVDLPGSTGPVGRGGGGGAAAHTPPPSGPLRPPLATALSLEGVYSCLAVSEPYCYVYDVGLVSTQLGANGTMKASRPPSGDILRSSLSVSVHVYIGMFVTVCLEFKKI